MKTENTLRTARNSLLCFFMALGAGLLAACGSSGSPTSPATSTPPQEFSAYLLDTAVEGVEYSGPEGDGLTGKGGVFLANEGVFVFSIGGTTLGRVSLNSDWANNEVTPADFIGVNDLQVITIARVMQALDEDAVSGPGLQNGISISQATRDDPENVSLLYSRVGTNVEEIPGNSVGDNNQQYTIPSMANARDHLAATRRCLFSGGYVGNFEGTLLSNRAELRGQSYYAVEPFANRVRRFTSGGNADFQSFETTSTVGVIGSAIILDAGNTLSFITPRLVTGVWQFARSDNVISSGTHNSLTLAADTGNPGATRRIVGVETTGTVTVAGMYVLDYFEGATVFLGRYYGVNATATINAVSSVPLSLTVVNDVSWPTAMAATTLTLSGDNATITVRVVRMDGNYGTFDGVGNELSGTWCDIGGAVGSTIAPTPSPRTPPAPSASAQSSTVIVVTWSAAPRATLYKLYRSTVSAGPYTQVGGDISALRYLDIGRTAETEYFYRLEACNSGGCSGRSPEVSATTQPSGGGAPAVVPTQPPAQPSAPSASEQSDTEIEVTWSAVSGATSYRLYRSTSSGGTYTQIGDDISALRYLDTGRSASTEYFYQLEACNSAGCSATRSPAGSATTQATPVAPAQPPAPSVSAQSDTEIEVTWNAVSGATSYKLYRSTSSGGTYTQIGGDISARRYLDSGRSASTEYFYQLEACNSAGCSATRSPAGSATTPA